MDSRAEVQVQVQVQGQIEERRSCFEKDFTPDPLGQSLVWRSVRSMTKDVTMNEMGGLVRAERQRTSLEQEGKMLT